MTVRRICRNGHIATRILNPGTTYTAMSGQVHAPAALPPENELLGAFAKWRRETMNLVMSVHMEQPGSHWVDFNEI